MNMRTLGLVSLTVGLGIIGVGCGSNSDGSSGSGGGTKPAGATCTLDAECASGACDKGKCGKGTDGKGTGGTTGTGAGGTSSGSGGTNGSSGASGASGSAGSSGPSGFTGSGNAGQPLKPGCGPDTSNECGGTCERTAGGGSTTTIIRPPVALCFAGAEDPTPENPTALIEQVIETINGVAMVHLRITFDPSFVDNTYGVNASSGWIKGTGGGGATGMMGGKMPAGKSGHTFSDLVGSDHVELLLTDGAGATVMDFKIDYVSVDASTPCGYGSLGVSGGEGKVIQGDASAVLGVATSIDRNLDGCGYCYTEDSPATDDAYTPNADAPNWDYRVVYEVWLALDAFGSAGFGQAYIQNVHASPSKLDTNTVSVTASPCPPGWDSPFCPPELVQADGRCGQMKCQPNYEVYVTTEGLEICTPIPFGGYPGMKPCPDGYQLDAATEGRYCLPVP
jgi:hypothetical protein